MKHKWETHSVTEINGAGVQTEYWEQCAVCGDMQTQWDAPNSESCPGKPLSPSHLNPQTKEK